MINRRLGTALAALPLALTLAACGSSSGSGGQSTAGSSSALSSSSSAPAPTSSAPTSNAPVTSTVPGDQSTTKVLIARVRAGLASVRSVHVAGTTKVSGQSQTFTADEALGNGTVQAADLEADLAGRGFALRIVGTKIWGKLPGVGTTAKPWVLITATSSNPTVKIFAKSLSSVTTNLGLQQSLQFLTAAASVRNVGNVQVDGMSATRYAVVVDYRKLPASYPNKQLILSTGLTTAPVEIYLDSKGRPVRIDTQVKVGATTTSTIVKLSKFNAPVSISAPPAAQISAG